MVQAMAGVICKLCERPKPSGSRVYGPSRCMGEGTLRCRALSSAREALAAGLEPVGSWTRVLHAGGVLVKLATRYHGAVMGASAGLGRRAQPERLALAGWASSWAVAIAELGQPELQARNLPRHSATECERLGCNGGAPLCSPAERIRLIRSIAGASSASARRAAIEEAAGYAPDSWHMERISRALLDMADWRARETFDPEGAHLFGEARA